MRYWFLWLLLLTASIASAQTVLSVYQQDEMVNLAPDARYLEDPDGKLTLEEVMRPEMQQKFKRLGMRMVNFGLTHSAFWLRSDLQNDANEKVIIEVGNNALSDIHLVETVDGHVVQRFHTGNWVPFDKREIKNVNYLFPLTVKKGEKATVYLRVVHNRGTQFRLKAGTLTAYYEKGTQRSILEGMYYGFMLLMVLYNLFLFFSLRDWAYLNYVLYIFFMALLNASINGFAFRYLWPSYPIINKYDDIVAAFAGIAGILFASRFLNTREYAPLFHKVFLILLAVYLVDIVLILSGFFLVGVFLLEVNSLILVASFFITAYHVLRNGYRPARFFLIAWSFLLLSVTVFILNNFNVIPSTTFATHSIQIGSAVEALLLSMALANRINVYKEEKRKAQLAALHSLEKNKKLIVEQNMMLERKVEERTIELKKANGELLTTLQNLKETQEQLVQREKMASLGELIAGIAHEIQNPLNFVNNFSELSSELVDELMQYMENGQVEKASGTADDLKRNLKKILHHGQRADSIVKSMLQHSRTREAKRERVNLNAIAGESLRLAYFSFRAKDSSFAAITETHFDESVGQVSVITQDMGRVLLNLFNNAFYSVSEKKKQLGKAYQPVVSVNTRKEKDCVSIVIRDNGLGIPENVQSKVYQPFFTTKPAGEGTGLGLSLSYDIITKGHGGQLQFESTEGEGTTFLVQIPAT